ncbi:uncharacterized protein LOC119082370 [Bradysia coprophila]|uniref:uncharacterized protein LOC119082370 n=1 Tax=Bradysia coprophila TaxID=38358 RepID=UPI00187D7911|nr:uncharacterized protein LOC119082370 [Bradysia coprophila]
METPSSDVKYHKLATEYSKIRAHANVLKRALLEEQNKSAGLRESLRQKDTSLRRFEQEVDSLGFRNKQLEHRVASLQEDLDRECKQKQSNKNSKTTKSKTASTVDTTQHNDIASDKLFVEEFQKKILENSQLVSLVADKSSEIELQMSRIAELEQQLSNVGVQRAECERNLRKEIENLIAKNSSLETKLSDETSIIGSDDALSVSESEHTPTHLLNSSDERISKLEREVFHWKTKYELLEKGNALEISTENNTKIGATITDNATKDSILYNHFNKKLDDLFEQKCLAQSKAINMEAESESLRRNLTILQSQLSKNELKFVDTQRNWQIAEEDLATTRINYEEQISVLTEQVISLSEQLAEMK